DSSRTTSRRSRPQYRQQQVRKQRRCSSTNDSSRTTSRRSRPQYRQQQTTRAERHLGDPAHSIDSNKRLEQNDISEIPPKAFSSYKRLRRMMVVDQELCKNCLHVRATWNFTAVHSSLWTRTQQ
ncbi:hypothetical protein J6590_105809, partial [Homalodisca vitripennis]